MKSEEIINNEFLEGSIWKGIVKFSIPLLLGNFFQLLYNMVDTYVVGNYIGSAALGAVGQSSIFIIMLVGLFMGFATGASVVIAQYLGAGKLDKMSKAIHTTMMFAFIMCIIISLLGIFISKPILILIGSPKDVMPLALEYLRIFFGGVSFLLIYNMAAGVLRAIGDSKRPFYYLLISTFINIVLDFYTVLGLKMGVRGAAIATVIAQAVSAILILIRLFTVKADYKLSLKKMCIDKECLIRIIQIGVPTALQTAIISFSNMWVQSYINGFGTAAIAGYSTYTKIDSFIILPGQSISMAITTFAGQNYGARNYDRIKKGISSALIMQYIITAVFIVTVLIFGRNLVGIFTGDKDVIEAGFIQAQIFVLGYITIPINNTISGVLRGVGLTKVPMYFMVGSHVILRQIYLAIFCNVFHDLKVVYMGWPLTWLICSAALIIYYLRTDISKIKRKV
ncbi:putative efflux protein, MATE family [Acetitomaculum ruminis DSM 5522]|uniref:Putative efflux protein, MATE family n=1 Tax=Acetitomaculum ruminis DSM 5522 TaxID=1120918 RepID=A0A1I0YSW9_9FIRM|nr:MATE family efflux transporter [Acetitomaculum ruminis]SFB16301.1 putative efflux protein, MATE family [Acetitomaculum ruminis DSM 5522]